MGESRMATGAHDGRPLIVFAHQGLDWIAGSEQCLLDLVERLDRRRFRRLVVCDAPTLARAAERLGAQAVLVPKWGRSPLSAAVARERLLPVLRASGASLIHANAAKTLPVLLPAAYRLGVPLVSHLHLPYESVGERLQHMVRESAVAVGVARWGVEAVLADGMPPDRVRVIYSAVNTERLAAGEASALRSTLGLRPGACLILSVGALIRRKGHDVTIRALARVRARGRDAHLVICGTGEEEGALRALAADVGVTPFVHLLGYRPDVGAIMRDASDLCVTSAREEALPLNVLEAQWLGLPVVASDIPPHREALAPGRSGVLFPMDSVTALAECIECLIAAPDRRAALGAAGRAFVREHFSMARYVGEFEALYAELLARPRGTFGGRWGSNWPRALTSWLRISLRRRMHKLRRSVGTTQ